jgi:hypothetical protein
LFGKLNKLLCQPMKAGEFMPTQFTRGSGVTFWAAAQAVNQEISSTDQAIMGLQSAEEAEIMQLSMRHQHLAKGITQLLKLRCKTYRFAPWLAKVGLIQPEFRDTCHMCLEPEKEDEVHLLLSCKSFISEIEKLLSNWIRRALQRTAIPDEIVALLLEGEFEEEQLDDRAISHSAIDKNQYQENLLNDSDTKDMKEETEGRSNYARLDVARFIQIVSRLRAHRLASVSLEQIPSRAEAHQGMAAHSCCSDEA